MVIEVLEPGLLTTVQDVGRYGYQRYGIPPAGAADSYALRVGNILLGNRESEAGLEVTILGPTLRFEDECWITITGTNLGPHLNEQPLPLWETFHVGRGDILSFRSPERGMRAYLTIAGGIKVPPVLGSKSTYVPGNLGGFHGRPLRRGDRIEITPTRAHKQHLPEEYIPSYDLRSLRILLSSHEEYFPPSAMKTFLSSEYKVLPRSNRMGLRLTGPFIEHLKSADIISEPVCTGVIQVPGDGQPILLLADRQTTGGYTRIATVISADLHKAAQAQPGDVLSFIECSLEEAQRAYCEQEKRLVTLQKAVKEGAFSAESG